MKASKLSFILIIVLALAAGFGAWSFLSSAKTTIYLFNDNYKAGKPITSDMFTPSQIDTSVVDSLKMKSNVRYITSNNIDQVVGKSSLKSDVVVGSQFMSSMTDTYGGSEVEKKLSDNMVAITIPADNIIGVTSGIQSDSRVDLFVGYELGNGTAVENILTQNTRVVSAEFAETKNAQSGTATLSGVTVELTPAQAVQVAHALEFGKVRLGLVKQSGYKETTVAPFSQANLNLPQQQATQAK